MPLKDFIVGIVICLISLTSSAAEPIHACAPELEYPPYLFTDVPKSGTSGRPQLAGLSLDVLQHALKQAGQAPAVIEQLPLLRCLKMVERGLIAVVLNVSTAQIDPAPYYISKPYAQVHSMYFVSTLHWPRGIAIGTVEDLKSFNICGLLGNRFDSYGIDTALVDTGTKGYEALIAKLHAGRCDLFIEKREVMAGLAQRNPQLKNLLSSPTLRQTVLPEDSPIWLHFAVSRRIPNGEILLKQLNSSIDSLERNKQLEKWLAAYLNDKTSSDPETKPTKENRRNSSE